MASQNRLNGHTGWGERDTKESGTPFFADESAAAETRVVRETGGLVIRHDALAWDDIYKAPEAGSKEMNVASRLLPESIVHVDAAVQALTDNKVILADDAMLHLQAALRELFCSRRLGEGYAAVVNGLLSSLENRGTILLSLQQALAIRSCLVELRQRPALSFDEALNLIEDLERTGLNVDPRGTNELLGSILE